VQIFEAADTARRHKEVPCTLAMQFALRRNQLDLMVSMRSQDAYLGLPHDVFCFTMLQEIIARSINADIGEYKQFVGCLHLYDKHRAGAEQFLSERVQQSVSMPPMPLGDPWPSIGRVLEAEIDIRGGRAIASEAMAIDPYWLDLIRLLQVFAATGDAKMIRRLKNSLTFKGFCAYVDKRKDMKPRSPRQPSQPRLPF
jgi:thymidylate synthase